MNTKQSDHSSRSSTVSPEGEATNQNASGEGRALRVLVVDDNQDAGESLYLLLTHAGHEVYLAYDGLQGLEFADRYHPDVLILDIDMPGIDGYQLATQVRQRAWARNARLIAHTGFSRPADRRRSVAAGFDVHWVKPLDFRDLLAYLADQSDY